MEDKVKESKSVIDVSGITRRDWLTIAAALQCASLTWKDVGHCTEAKHVYDLVKEQLTKEGWM
jgi:hypothetical protein